MEAWMPAIITGIVSVVICLINNYATSQTHFHKQTLQIEDMIAHNERSIALIESKIVTLKSEVEKHNSIVERTYALESETGRFKEIVNNIRSDISDLKRTIEKIGDKL